MNRTRLSAAALVLVPFLLAGGCSSSPTTSSPTTSAPTATTAVTTAAVTTSAAAPVATTAAAPVASATSIELRPVSDMGPAWHLDAALAYGPGESQLGVSEKGSGPYHPAPGPDGAWWVPDTTNRRIARFDRSGAYLGSVAVDGILLYQQVLGNGWLVAPAIAGPVVVADTTSAHTVAMPADEQSRSWSRFDGELLYSLGDQDAADPTSIHTVTVRDGTVVYGTADAFRTPDGRRYDARVDPTDRSRFLLVELPDATPAVKLRLPVVGGGDGTNGGWALEVAADQAGSLHLLLTGTGPDNQTVGAYVRVGPDGFVSPSEPIRNPYSERNPGSPGRLHVVAGTNTVTLSFVDDDAVRLYSRAAG